MLRSMIIAVIHVRVPAMSVRMEHGGMMAREAREWSDDEIHVGCERSMCLMAMREPCRRKMDPARKATSDVRLLAGLKLIADDYSGLCFYPMNKSTDAGCAQRYDAALHWSLKSGGESHVLDPES